MNLLEELNDKQYEAVKNIEGPNLIIAGAGSGKTKVLTHKIAYLISEKNIKPWNILAITFTNKAANEMKERVRGLVGETVNDMWIGTFHSICVKILRKNIDRIGFESSFIIFDTSDQKAVMKKILKSENVDEKIFTEKSVLYEISNAKNEMIEPEQYAARVVGDFRKEKIAEIYSTYQKKLKENNAIDFDDIINFTVKILLDNPDLLDYYSEKFKYVLVDEYQDTNKSQFTLITLVASKYGNITVVGDNDQGIYAFRGADITNILNFEKDFPGTKIIKLEQNYRCTKNILQIANEIIKNNEKKYEKKLWTNNDDGTIPKIHRGDDEYDEANFIIEQINTLKIEEYYKYSDFAVLYRMNTQSRSIEDILRREDIPYKVIGGMKFYERKEIKDIIAYLRLIHNQTDNISLARVINEPKRGIGKTSLDKVEGIANSAGTYMYDVIKNADKYELNKVFTNTREFVNIIEEMKDKKDAIDLSELVEEILDKTGYVKVLENENTIESENRILNLEEFKTVVAEFEEEYADNSLSEFLEGITLSSDIDELEETDDFVTLMTLHSAKGLEFPVIFMVGMEDGVFPGYQAIGEEKEMEEERRLCYVGITRAKEKLFLSCAKQRTIFGSTSYNNISRFVKEIPVMMLDGFEELELDNKKDLFEDNKQEWEYGNNKKQSKKDREKSSFQFRSAESFLNNLNIKKNEDIDLSIYKKGVKIRHKKFGDGIIDKVEEEDDDLKVDITFEKSGHKRLMARFAGLEILD